MNSLYQVFCRFEIAPVAVSGMILIAVQKIVVAISENNRLIDHFAITIL